MLPWYVRVLLVLVSVILLGMWIVDRWQIATITETPCMTTWCNA